MMMGVETPIPPVVMNAAAPAGRPRGGFNTVLFDENEWKNSLSFCVIPMIKYRD